jgi:pimeloyl-ACP methyl ester carboxylesterase
MRPAAAIGLALLAGCASLPPAQPVAGARAELGWITLGGTDVEVYRFVPERAPIGVLLLQHGFARHCSHLRETALTLAAAGFDVLCLNADMARGHPALADALALHLARAPGPARIVVAGHSAGGLFAARVGAALAREAPERLAGALLFDPVDADGALGAALAAISAQRARPVLAFTAPPSACNASGNAAPALRGTSVVVALGAGATHLDVEGGDTDRLAVAACGEGAPRAEVVVRLRGLAVRAATAMAAGNVPDVGAP